MTEKNYRIISKIRDGAWSIQSQWFKSIEDAQEYIRQNADLVFPNEEIKVVRDYSVRTIPYWRANRPPTTRS